MSETDYELQYNSRKAIPGHVELAAQWDELAEAFRAQHPGERDIPYGSSVREKYDFFACPDADGSEPVCAYIHGGYWKSRDRKTFSHIAEGLNRQGISVALPSYDHCPNVTVMDIINQMRSFLSALWKKTHQHMVVAGHSAGGHLASCMLATRWSEVEGVPDDLVRRAFAISGIYDLRPICNVSVNEDVRLTPQTAKAASPLFWAPPPGNSVFTAAVGGLESAEFKRQSHTLIDVWSKVGVTAGYMEIPDANHFTVVHALSKPDNPYITRIVEMARGCAER